MSISPCSIVDQNPFSIKPDFMPDSNAIARVRKINQTWITRGEIAAHTERYLDHLAAHRPEILEAVCDRALAAAREASHVHKTDPKPAFYASLFSAATPEEQELFLKDHPFTRQLAAKLQQPSKIESKESRKAGK